MKTELEIVDHVVNEGHKIQVHSYAVRNYLIHQVCEPISQLMLGLIESDSNNSVAQNSARETRNFWAGWSLVKLEWAQAKAFRDSPRPEHEYQYDVLVPTRNEVMSVGNVKVKRVVQQLAHLVSVLIGMDSGKMQTWVGDGEAKEVDELLAQAEAVLSQYMGSGEVKDGKFDSGVVAPRYAFGQLIPDIDRNAASVWEPSSQSPQVSVPDVADGASIAPKPGKKEG